MSVILSHKAEALMARRDIDERDLAAVELFAHPDREGHLMFRALGVLVDGLIPFDALYT